MSPSFSSKAVLTVDIVEFSKKSLAEQMSAIQILIKLLRTAIPEEENSPSNRIWSPAGDGGCLTFWENTLAALETAANLGRLLDMYNQYVLDKKGKRRQINFSTGFRITKQTLENLKQEKVPDQKEKKEIPDKLLEDLKSLKGIIFNDKKELLDRVEAHVEKELFEKELFDKYKNLIAKHADSTKLPVNGKPFQVRMGIHVGPVAKQKDFDERENIWGYGINISNRVASLGKPSQIVVSKQYYSDADLKNQTEDYISAPIGTWWAKHNEPLELYNICCKDETRTVGIQAEEVEGWYASFHLPLQQVINSYLTMLENEKITYRALLLAKRIMDLCSTKEQEGYSIARDTISSISKSKKRRFTEIGETRAKGGENGQEKKISYKWDDFFSPLSPEALLYFCNHAHFRSYKVGDSICEQGDVADSMMLVVSGKIELYFKDQQTNRPQKTNILLGEGQIVGEMGLFNPLGRKRTATLKAAKNAVTLDLNYASLEIKKNEMTAEMPQIEEYFGYKGFLDTGDSSQSEIEEILERIWELYCNRTIQNQLRNVPGLFDHLSKFHPEELKELEEKSEILPKRYYDTIHLSPREEWGYLTIVVEGVVTAYTRKRKVLTFTKGDWLGIVRLIADETPFVKLEVSSDTHLVRLPWEFLKKFRDRKSEHCIQEFRAACSERAMDMKDELKDTF